MSKPLQQTVFRRMAWAIGLAALALSVLSVFLVHQYGATRPSVGDSSRTHAVKSHSRVVYLTNGEYVTALASHALTILAIGSFLGVLLKSKARKA